MFTTINFLVLIIYKNMHKRVYWCVVHLTLMVILSVYVCIRMFILSACIIQQFYSSCYIIMLIVGFVFCVYATLFVDLRCMHMTGK